MNAKKSKKLRKAIYGEEGEDPKYYRAIKTRQRLREPKRRLYKLMKKENS